MGATSVAHRTLIIGTPQIRDRGRIHWLCSRQVCNHYSWQARGAWRVSPVLGSAFHALREPWWFIPFDLLRVKPLLDGFPVFGVTSAGSRPGGRPSFLLYDKKEGKETYPAAAPPSGVPSLRRCRAGSSQTRPSGSDMRSPFSARHHLQSARQRGPEMRVINGRSPSRLPERLGAPLKARLNRRAAHQQAGPSGAAV